MLIGDCNSEEDWYKNFALVFLIWVLRCGSRSECVSPGWVPAKRMGVDLQRWGCRVGSRRGLRVGRTSLALWEGRCLSAFGRFRPQLGVVLRRKLPGTPDTRIGLIKPTALDSRNSSPPCYRRGTTVLPRCTFAELTVTDSNPSAPTPWWSECGGLPGLETTHLKLSRFKESHLAACSIFTNTYVVLKELWNTYVVLKSCGILMLYQKSCGILMLY